MNKGSLVKVTNLDSGKVTFGFFQGFWGNSYSVLVIGGETETFSCYLYTVIEVSWSELWRECFPDEKVIDDLECPCDHLMCGCDVCGYGDDR